MIRIEQLSKHYGPRQVLSGIDITFEPGHVYGIVGENGAGKTTLFQCITGMEDYSGTVTAPFRPLKDHIGYLQTDPYFFPRITGREYIRLLSGARGITIDDIDSRNVFDLPLGQYAATYSTGMKKKLALTAVLLQQCPYYIFDEPFNGVDIQSNILIFDILRQLRQLGKTILISSHIFSTLTDLCDEIHLLKQGRFVRRADRTEFGALEQEMNAVFVGKRIERLQLR